MNKIARALNYVIDCSHAWWHDSHYSNTIGAIKSVTRCIHSYFTFKLRTCVQVQHMIIYWSFKVNTYYQGNEWIISAEVLWPAVYVESNDIFWWTHKYRDKIFQATFVIWVKLQYIPRIEHDDVIKWKHFPRCWPFVRGIHRSPVNSTRTGQWRGALMLSFICVSISGWVNNHEAGDLRRHHAHYDVTVIICA